MSDSKLHRLPTVGVGTTSSGPPPSKLAARNSQQHFSDLNNNQLTGQTKSLPINTATTATTSSKPPGSASTSSRRLEDVQVSLVINRAEAAAAAATANKKASDSDAVNTEIDDIKAPFQVASTTADQLRRSSANLASDPNALGIDTPETRIGRSFKSLQTHSFIMIYVLLFKHST